MWEGVRRGQAARESNGEQRGQREQKEELYDERAETISLSALNLDIHSVSTSHKLSRKHFGLAPEEERKLWVLMSTCALRNFFGLLRAPIHSSRRSQCLNTKHSSWAL